MDSNEYGSGCEFSSFIIHHLVFEADGFLIRLKHCRTNCDEIPGLQLSLLFDMLLDGGHARLPLTGESGRGQ
jgi:hypothetical protein